MVEAQGVPGAVDEAVPVVPQAAFATASLLARSRRRSYSLPSRRTPSMAMTSKNTPMQVPANCDLERTCHESARKHASTVVQFQSMLTTFSEMSVQMARNSCSRSKVPSVDKGGQKSDTVSALAIPKAFQAAGSPPSVTQHINLLLHEPPISIPESPPISIPLPLWSMMLSGELNVWRNRVSTIDQKRLSYLIRPF